MVGDLAGFAAAAYMRGLPVVQVPTTLLAQVDASIGGKVAVNHPRGKNLIGAFHQPRLVIIDPESLRTLPEREYRSGLAEVVKTGAALDADLFRSLETGLEALRRRDADLLEAVVATCCEEKAPIVEQDEREETGLRMVLNYGHTVGHALEALSGYRRWLHGEAVAIGMAAAGRLAVRLGLGGRDRGRAPGSAPGRGRPPDPVRRHRPARDRRRSAPRQEGPGRPRALHPDEERGAGRGLPRRPGGDDPPGLAGDPAMTRAPMRATEREPMRRMRWALVMFVLILGTALAGCDSPNRSGGTQPSAASGFFLDLVASPNVVRGATGGTGEEAGGCALVQAKVYDTKGQLVDGTPVAFGTTLCCFAGPDEINIVSQVVTTFRGTATVTFCGKRERGTATITAAVEDAFDTVLITVF